MTTVEKPDDRHAWVGAIVTVTGDEFDFINPTPEMIDLDVMAHSLALLNRYNGHIPYPYSVAEHSVRVSRWLEAEGCPAHVQLKGLWHDAPEAFAGDMVKPMKMMSPLGDAYLEVEHRIAVAISPVLGFDIADLPSSVKAADKAIFEWETANIRTGRFRGWNWEFAREAMLRQHERLANESVPRFWDPHGRGYRTDPHQIGPQS